MTLKHHLIFHEENLEKIQKLLKHLYPKIPYQSYKPLRYSVNLFSESSSK